MKRKCLFLCLSDSIEKGSRAFAERGVVDRSGPNYVTNYNIPSDIDDHDLSFELEACTPRIAVARRACSQTKSLYDTFCAEVSDNRYQSLELAQKTCVLHVCLYLGPFT